VETHTYVLVLEVSNLGTLARFLVFFSEQQEPHARSTPTLSHLLLNSWKRQDLKSCSVALCASAAASREIVLHLSRKIVLPYKTSVSRPKTAIFANFLVSFFDVRAISYYIYLSVDINST
jgi:hypothetical protein